MKKMLLMLGAIALICSAAWAETLVTYGSRTECGYTRRLDSLLADAKVKGWIASNAVAIVDCDKVQQAQNYAAYRSKVGYTGGKWPQVFVVADDGTVMGSFVARGYNASSLIAKLDSLCATCSEDPPTVPTEPAVPVVPPAAAVSKFNCPKCKAVLEVK